MDKIKSAPPSVLKSYSGKDCMNEMNIAAGSVSKGNYKEPKTTGIKIRGTTHRVLCFIKTLFGQECILGTYA